MFISPYFKWRNKSCKDYFLFIVSDEDIVNKIGIPYKNTVTKDDSVSLPVYNDDEEDAEEFTLRLCLANENKALEWNNEIFKDIKDWLITGEFEEFISYDNLDMIYYLKVVGLQKVFSYGNEGFIDVTFKPMSHYAYKRVIVKENIRGEKLINIYNNCNSAYEPLIIIQNNGTKKTINSVNGFIIQGLDVNEVAYVDNYMSNVVNNEGENLLPLCNRNWIKLNKGDNQLLIEGNCNVEIYCEFPSII